MSELSVIIKALLEADEAASSAKIRGQIPSIEAALKGSPIKVPIEVDTAKVNESAAKVKKGFDDALNGKSATGSVLDAGMAKLKEQLGHALHDLGKEVGRFIRMRRLMSLLKALSIF